VATVVLGTILGALLLVVAEFTPLAHVHSTASGAGVIKTLGTGSNHSYALVPIALLASALALSARLGTSRLALLAIVALGLVALGIALLGDLPDAQASGIIRHGASYVSAASHPAIGLYLESFGAVLLLFSGGTGLLLAPARARP
jgi:hypothetical protein